MFLFMSHLAFADASSSCEHLRLLIWHWLSSSLWHMSCPHFCSCGAPEQAPSAEDGRAFAPEDMEKIWETSGFAVREPGCVFLDLFSQWLHWIKLV